MIKQEFRFLQQASEYVAPALLGCILEREINGRKARVRIVEVEAYHQSDPASHSFNGKTPRTEVMFGPAGHVYIYFTYGMHYCCNIVTGQEGVGEGVLIRAVEPIDGEDLLQENRPFNGTELTNGPAKLCQALAIDKSFNGHDASQPPYRLIPQPPLPKSAITQTTRIGISKAKDVPWRFYITGNRFVSRQ